MSAVLRFNWNLCFSEISVTHSFGKWAPFVRTLVEIRTAKISSKSYLFEIKWQLGICLHHPVELNLRKYVQCTPQSTFFFHFFAWPFFINFIAFPGNSTRNVFFVVFLNWSISMFLKIEQTIRRKWRSIPWAVNKLQKTNKNGRRKTSIECSMLEFYTFRQVWLFMLNNPLAWKTIGDNAIWSANDST